MEENIVADSNKKIFQMRATHLGTIGFRLAIFALCVCVGALLGSVFTALIFVFVAMIGFVLPIITLGFVVALDPNYFENLSNLLNSSSTIMGYLGQAFSYCFVVTIPGFVGAILGAIFLGMNKTEKHPVKLTFCIISSILCVIITILGVSGVFSTMGN